MTEKEKNELRNAIEVIKNANISSKEWEDLFEKNDFEKALSIMTTAYSIVAVNEEKDLAKRVTNMLRQMVVPAYIPGHRCLIECMCLINEDKTYLKQIVGRLYVDVAKRTNSNAGKVEKSIRHAIDIAFERGPKTLMEPIFGTIIAPNKTRPTNKAFIARIAELIGILE